MTTAFRWENVRSRVVLYREILKTLFTLESHDSRLQKAVTEYLSLIVFHAKYLDDFRIDEQPDIPMEPLDVLFLKTMGLGDYRVEVNETVILSGLEKLAADYENIILYGAGKVGRLFFRFLKDKGLHDKVICYAISENPKVKTSADGIPVLPIREAVRKKGTIFLSVVEAQAQKSMRETLKQLGITQFEFFDQYMYRALRHYVRKLEPTGEFYR